MADGGVVALLAKELQNTKEGLKNIDETIKKVTGRDDFGRQQGVTDAPLFHDQRIVTTRNVAPRSFIEQRRVARVEPSSGSLRLFSQARRDIVQTEDQPPLKRRVVGDAFSRLGPRVDIQSRLGRPRPPARRESPDEDEDIVKPALPSSVVARESKSRQDALAEQKQDENSKNRNRRMFGVLLGTLQQFKKEETHHQQQERQKLEVEKKLEQKALQEKENLRKEKAALFDERRKKQRQLRRLEQKMELVKDHEDWVVQTLKLTNFIRTKSKPYIFYLPKEMTDVTDRKQDETKKSLNKVIEERRKLLENEIEALVNEDKADNGADEEEMEEEDEDIGMEEMPTVTMMEGERGTGEPAPAKEKAVDKRNNNTKDRRVEVDDSRTDRRDKNRKRRHSSTTKGKVVSKTLDERYDDEEKEAEEAVKLDMMETQDIEEVEKDIISKEDEDMPTVDEGREGTVMDQEQVADGLAETETVPADIPLPIVEEKENTAQVVDNMEEMKKDVGTDEHAQNIEQCVVNVETDEIKTPSVSGEKIHEKLSIDDEETSEMEAKEVMQVENNKREEKKDDEKREKEKSRSEHRTREHGKEKTKEKEERERREDKRKDVGKSEERKAENKHEQKMKEKEKRDVKDVEKSREKSRDKGEEKRKEKERVSEKKKEEVVPETKKGREKKDGTDNKHKEKVGSRKEDNRSRSASKHADESNKHKKDERETKKHTSLELKKSSEMKVSTKSSTRDEPATKKISSKKADIKSKESEKRKKPPIDSRKKTPIKKSRRKSTSSSSSSSSSDSESDSSSSSSSSNASGSGSSSGSDSGSGSSSSSSSDSESE